jgi:hypothetical protein
MPGRPMAEVLPRLMDNPDMLAARRVAFCVSKIAHDLGINGTGVPVDGQLQAILDTAMERPADVSPEAYRLVYTLAHGAAT